MGRSALRSKVRRWINLHHASIPLLASLLVHELKHMDMCFIEAMIDMKVLYEPLLHTKNRKTLEVLAAHQCTHQGKMVEGVHATRVSKLLEAPQSVCNGDSEGGVGCKVGFLQAHHLGFGEGHAPTPGQSVSLPSVCMQDHPAPASCWGTFLHLLLLGLDEVFAWKELVWSCRRLTIFLPCHLCTQIVRSEGEGLTFGAAFLSALGNLPGFSEASFPGFTSWGGSGWSLSSGASSSTRSRLKNFGVTRTLSGNSSLGRQKRWAFASRLQPPLD